MLHIFTSVIIHALIYSGVREDLHAMGLHGFVAYLAAGVVVSLVVHVLFRRWFNFFGKLFFFKRRRRTFW
jgi:hypothetical protein